MPHVILTALGNDRPGLVGELTAELFGRSVNILETRMVNLRGQFALMMLIDVSDDGLRSLNADLPARAKAMGLNVHVATQDAPAASVRGLAYRLRSYSVDQPGIIARLAAPLRAVGANIEELSARQETAPFAGEPIFIAEFRLIIPSTTNLQQLRKDLEALATSLHCDIDLEPMKSV